MSDNKTWKTGYVSEAEKFLQSLESIEGATSPSRQAEEEKYHDIMGKRDNIETKTNKSKLWDGF